MSRPDVRHSDPFARPTLSSLSEDTLPKALRPILHALTVGDDGALMFGEIVLTSVGLFIPEDMPVNQEQDEILLDMLLRLDGSLAWMIGDMLRRMDRVHGITYEQVAEVTGRDVATLRDYVYVASNVHLSFRNDILSWTHHKAVAPLPQEDQEYWLRMAQAQGWSAAKLRSQIASHSAPVAIANPMQLLVSPDALKTLRKLSKLTPEKIAKLKPGQVKEFRRMWDEATKEFGAVYVALLNRDEALRSDRQ
jgi:hypothetical protein